jgi:hypothetical protein|tara:strand:+ start:129 stop:359 length:231 start_codon:yes stop_codon:yes gene_type:complete
LELYQTVSEFKMKFNTKNGWKGSYTFVKQKESVQKKMKEDKKIDSGISEIKEKIEHLWEEARQYKKGDPADVAGGE